MAEPAFQMDAERSTQIDQFVARIEPFLDAMLADMKYVGSVPRTPETSAPQDRANIRTFFVVLDALSNFLRSQALFLHHLGWKGLDPKLLKELEPAARLTLRDNVKVSLRALAALRNPRLPPLDLGQSAGWARLMEVETVRDRITHPKTANDLIVSTPECIAFNEAVLWYFRILLDCLALPRPSFLGTAPP
jgi:hypothetical protein